jgi:hypothetical protein
MEDHIVAMLQNKLILRSHGNKQLNQTNQLIQATEPIKIQEPEPIKIQEHEPIKIQEPEPIKIQEPEPIKIQEPEPIKIQEPEPIKIQEPEPIKIQEPEPIKIQEPEPIPIPIPKIAFIVPYRDRSQHLHFFKEQMSKVLSNMQATDYKIYFAHQQDNRPFNRGAMKNIGFLVIKEKYPNDYKNITLVFNDVDTMPYHKNFLNYDTDMGIVKHFYGYKYALGGIVSIKAGDFEKTRGFPNFWAWGYEDNALKQRVDRAGLKLDYSQFYPILDGNILQLKDGVERLVSRTEFDKFIVNDTDGFSDITDLTYVIDDKTGFINITSFEPKSKASENEYKVHSLDNGNKPFSGRRPKFGRMLF